MCVEGVLLAGWGGERMARISTCRQLSSSRPGGMREEAGLSEPRESGFLVKLMEPDG